MTPQKDKMPDEIFVYDTKIGRGVTYWENHIAPTTKYVRADKAPALSGEVMEAVENAERMLDYCMEDVPDYPANTVAGKKKIKLYRYIRTLIHAATQQSAQVTVDELEKSLKPYVLESVDAKIVAIAIRDKFPNGLRIVKEGD